MNTPTYSQAHIDVVKATKPRYEYHEWLRTAANHRMIDATCDLNYDSTVEAGLYASVPEAATRH